MRGKARGADVLACHDSMVQGQGDASRLLRDAHAMTDVTGFGLAGHLSAICRASGTGAVLDAVPCCPARWTWPGPGCAPRCFDDNVAHALPVTGSEGPLRDLLFDPQTCGGLLAAMAGDAAEETCAALCAAGYPARVIGRVTEGTGISLQT